MDLLIYPYNVANLGLTLHFGTMLLEVYAVCSCRYLPDEIFFL